MALWVAPLVQAHLISSRQIMAFLCAYAVGSVPLHGVRLLEHRTREGERSNTVPLTRAHCLCHP